MASMLCVDKDMEAMFEPLKPHKSMHSVTKYRTLSPNISWPKPVVATFSASLSKQPRASTGVGMEEFEV